MVLHSDNRLDSNNNPVLPQVKSHFGIGHCQFLPLQTYSPAIIADHFARIVTILPKNKQERG